LVSPLSKGPKKGGYGRAYRYALQQFFKSENQLPHPHKIAIRQGVTC